VTEVVVGLQHEKNNIINIRNNNWYILFNIIALTIVHFICINIEIKDERKVLYKTKLVKVY